VQKKLGSMAAEAVVLGLTLMACGGDDNEASPADAATTTEATVTVDDFNTADVTFAQAMIPHHEQAVEMAELALDPASGAGPAVRDLAARIEAAQDPEIELMTGWLTAWDQPLEMDMGHDDHDMSAMDGMMSAEDMDALAAATGADFDRLWTEMMVAHHEGAITMAEAAQTEGSNPDVLALAGRIITAQQQEIDEMQDLLAR
jgi:uncharacterized protein (DUF305 family)